MIVHALILCVKCCGKSVVPTNHLGNRLFYCGQTEQQQLLVLITSTNMFVRRSAVYGTLLEFTLALVHDMCMSASAGIMSQCVTLK